MRLAIVGSRDFPKLSAVRRFVLALPDGTVVVSGHGRGVDQMAEHTARFERGLEVISWRVLDRQDGWYQPERWHFDPRRAEDGDAVSVEPRTRPDGRPEVHRSWGRCAYARNRFIVEEADVVAAFWDGVSPGTKNTIDLADELERRVELYGKDSVT